MLVKISDAEWLVLKCERDREEKNGRTTLTERARETQRERAGGERKTVRHQVFPKTIQSSRTLWDISLRGRVKGEGRGEVIYTRNRP